MDEYMRVADAVITKPGGLTTAECVALRKPIIAVEPIPGQEDHNAQFIMAQQFGALAQNSLDLLYYSALDPAALAPGYARLRTEEKTSAQIILERFTLPPTKLKL